MFNGVCIPGDPYLNVRLNGYAAGCCFGIYFHQMFIHQVS